MAATLFARMEGAALDGTHDFSGGDTSWTLTGVGTAFDSTQSKVGSNSLNASGGTDNYATLASAGIVSSAEGSFGGWVRFSTVAEFNRLVVAEGTDTGDMITLDVSDTDELRLRYGVAGEGAGGIVTSGLNLVAGAWYGYVARYRFVSSNTYAARLEVYDASGALITSVENTGFTVFGAHTDIVALHVGTLDGNARCFHDNFIWANDYNEAIQDKLALSSYTQYSGGGGSTTAIPTTGLISILGREPATNAFTNVRYQEVLVNAAGSPVSNRTGLRLSVWYSGQCAGAPDLSYSDLTTGAAGTASYSIASGSLVFGQKAFGVITDGGASLSSYTCGLLSFTYS